jgi:S-adenosylmethionine decarboxylase
MAGWHLIVDGVVDEKNVELLGDVKFLDQMFRDLIKLLKMEILVEPAFRVVPLDPSKLEDDGDEGGVTGTAVITTSHVSVHTWPLRAKFSLDVFSCRSFDPDEAYDFLQKRLGITKRTIHWVERKWP